MTKHLARLVVLKSQEGVQFDGTSIFLCVCSLLLCNSTEGADFLVTGSLLIYYTIFLQALGKIAHEHLKSGTLCSQQYPLNCPGCVNPDNCRKIVNPISPYARVKDMTASA
jgi:hypothetical protein